MPEFDMQRIKNIHFVGVGGCGMSGLARIVHELGYKVSGSDTREGSNTIRLKDLGVKIFIGHDADFVRDADLLVYSSAVTDVNPEIMAARAKQLPIIKRAEMLAWIMNQSKTRIAVAGTHGKTTTTAMLARVFEAGGLKPTYLIGCDMDYVDGNAKLGDGRYAIAEADESDSSFLLLSPNVGIITNIEEDHMERFGSREVLLETFRQFAEKIPDDGLLVIDGTDASNLQIVKALGRRHISYGLKGEVEFSVKDISYDQFTSHYTLLRAGKELGEVSLSVPGWQNVLNSLPVFAIGLEFGLDFSTIAAALRTFIGARRRFQIVGKYEDILIIDDYAHHPTEVRATLSAAKSGWPDKRLICIFQPHRYSRTALLKDQFGQAFKDADKVIISDIYAASEEPIPGISGQSIVDAIEGQDVEYIPKKEKIADFLLKNVQPGDIVLTLGAGDIYTVGKEYLTRLKMQ